MNTTRWLIGFGFLFILGTFISNMMEGIYYGTEGLAFVSAMNHFSMAFSNIVSWSAGWNMLAGVGDMMTAIVQFITWDYSFFYGTWELFRYMLWAVSFGFILSLALEIANSLRWI